MSARDRVAQHRVAMRERGFRQVQLWVPDTRTEEFKREAWRQALAVAAADRAGDNQDFIEQTSEDWPEWTEANCGRSQTERTRKSPGRH
ncbi:antitoxin MazE family protein [Arthrobacter sp. D1-29]